MRQIAFLICILALYAGAYEPLSGRISGTYPAGDYIVTGTIHVELNRSLTFEAGSRLFFEQYCGITVQGSLVLNGSAEKPILLTSRKEYPEQQPGEQPGPFDWNGIEAEADAELLSLEYVEIRHSVFGLNIKSENSKTKLKMVEFFDNGYASIMRGEKIIPVQPKTLFSKAWNPETGNGTGRGTLPPKKAVSQNNDHNNEKIKLGFSIGSAAFALTGITVLTTYTIQKEKNLESYNRQQDSHGARHFREQYEQNCFWQGVGGTLIGVALAGVGVTFLF
ncbi:MAG: hypothetical protein ACLFVQ_05945 [Chitinispirillaceae bacterium]